MDGVDGSLRAALADMAGSAAFARGAAYALEGNVLDFDWYDEGGRLEGTVEGTDWEPYVATAVFERSTSGRVTHVDGHCTCPVGVDCKHVVALVLTAARAEPRPRKTAGGDRDPVHHRAHRPAPWELALRPLTGDVAEGSADDPSLGLLFEVVGAATREAEPTAPVRIRLRPVTRSHTGKWVRAHVRWSTLDHLRYRLPGDDRLPRFVALLQELRSLAGASGRHYYVRYGDDDVWLESVASRRVWDVFEEANQVGLPLVAGARQHVPVVLGADRGRVCLDAARRRGGLDLRPRITVGEVVVPPGRALLLGGDPAHGVAWWDVRPGSDEAYGLSLARLARPLDGRVAELLKAGPMEVPTGDEDRFVGAYLPDLREHVEVISVDGSVVLPDPVPRHLELSVTSPDRATCQYHWSWVRGPVGRVPRRPVGRLATDPQELQGELGTLASAVAVLAGTGMVETTEAGDRLVEDGSFTGMAAVDFVTRVIPALASLEGVEIDRDPGLPDFREASGPPVVSLDGEPTSGQIDWFDLRVVVTVDGEEVPFQQLFVALAEGQTHLLLPSGTYVSLDAEELRRLAALITEGRALREAPEGVVRVSRLQSDWWEEVRELGVLSEQAATWEASVRSLLAAGEGTDHPVPPGVEAELRSYQLDGFRWLAARYDHELGGILADDMGLGKTLQALALMEHVCARTEGDRPFLVVAPTSVVQNWVSECRRFTPGLRVFGVSEGPVRRGDRLAKLVDDVDLVVTSYALFRRDYDEYEEVPWAGLFLDEAQFIKTHTSQIHRRVRALPVPYKVAITGTPMENNLMELWSLLAVTAPGFLGDTKRFTAYYRTPIERSGDHERLDQLRRRIRPLMLRRTKEEVAAELPDKLEQTLELELVPRHRKVYDAYLQRERQKVLGMLGDLDRHRFEIFRSLTLLRQASLDVGLVDEKHAGVPSTKLDVLMEMVEEVVADGHRVLIFSQFTRFLRQARERIGEAGIDYCYLDGRTRKREAVIERFQGGGTPVFLVSLKAGGFGLNLTAADYCILLDPWWNPAVEAQAVDRTHRIGQTRRVMVYRLVARDTIEEKVMAMKAKKAALFANVIDTGELASGALTADDIRGLLE